MGFGKRESTRCTYVLPPVSKCHLNGLCLFTAFQRVSPEVSPRAQFEVVLAALFVSSLRDFRPQTHTHFQKFPRIYLPTKHAINQSVRLTYGDKPVNEDA